MPIEKSARMKMVLCDRWLEVCQVVESRERNRSKLRRILMQNFDVEELK